MEFIYDLSLPWIGVTVFAVLYGIGILLAVLASGVLRAWLQPFAGKIATPLLTMIATIFALYVTFLANNVWNDAEKARDAVHAEASAADRALGHADYLQGPGGELRGRVLAYAKTVVEVEWPLMSEQRELTRLIPMLEETARAALAIDVGNDARKQHARDGFVRAIDAMRDARELRLAASRDVIDPFKWSGVFVLAFLTLLTYAIMHAHDRKAQAVGLFIFSTAAAVIIFVILAHDRPFAGPLAIAPDGLERLSAAPAR